MSCKTPLLMAWVCIGVTLAQLNTEKGDLNDDDASKRFAGQVRAYDGFNTESKASVSSDAPSSKTFFAPVWKYLKGENFYFTSVHFSETPPQPVVMSTCWHDF